MPNLTGSPNVQAYGRCYRVEIQGVMTLEQTIKKPGLAIDFKVKRSLASDSKKSPNTLELKVYNIARDNLQLLSNDQIITLSCGYAGELGVIFSGTITNVGGMNTGTNKCVIIQAKESTVVTIAEWDKQSLTIKAGTTFKEAIESICSSMVSAFPSITDFKTESLPTTQIPRDIHLIGDPFDSMWNLLVPFGLIYYVNSGTVWVVPGTGKKQYLTTEISADNGLIGSAQKVVDRKRNRKSGIIKTGNKVESTGWQFTSLLNPVLELGDRVDLTLSSPVKNNFGTAISRFPTLQITDLVFLGNSFNGKWQVVVTALDVPLPPSIAPLNEWENPITLF